MQWQHSSWQPGGTRTRRTQLTAVLHCFYLHHGICHRMVTGHPRSTATQQNDMYMLVWRRRTTWDAHSASVRTQVKSRQIWGDLVYTPDSDLVAVLMHLGYYAHTLSHPPANVVEVRVLIKLVPPQASYPSKARFVKSRAWNSPTEVCAFRVRWPEPCGQMGWREAWRPQAAAV